VQAAVASVITTIPRTIWRIAQLLSMSFTVHGHGWQFTGQNGQLSVTMGYCGRPTVICQLLTVNKQGLCSRVEETITSTP
jgi:hypothetical protein